MRRSNALVVILPFRAAFAPRCISVGVTVAQLLLNHGASPYAKSGHGDTVFDDVSEFELGNTALGTLFRKYLAINIRRFVLGTAAEYPRRARLRDLVPLIATYIV